jgi:uroporphyrinogen decarboxylase
MGGPFTTAAFLRGTEDFLKDISKNPEMAHKLLEISTQSVINYIDAVCDLGLSPSIAEPVASGTMISAKTFREFAKPYLKKCMDRIIERRGSGSTLHICGTTKKIWADMVETGIGNLSLDNIDDIGELKELFGDKVCLIGNVAPVETIMRGTIEEIYDAGKLCISKAYDSPKGFILSSGCDIPIGTHPDKIIALMDCARIYGQNPAKFVEKAKEIGADIICLSTLMTTTMQGMQEVIEILDEQNLRGKIKVMIGGGPVSNSFAKRIGADAYTTDASKAVEMAKEMLRI